MKPNIYTYLDYRRYLTDFYNELKRTTKHFSFRFFAKAAGFKAPNYLKLVMDGKRNLSQDGIRKFCRGLKLNKGEQEFFENLVNMNQCRRDEEKNFYYQRLTQSKRYMEAKGLEKGQYDYYSKWYNVAIREMAALPSFNEDASLLAARLGNNVTPKDVKESIELLIKLRLLERGKDGRLAPSDSALTTGPEVKSLAVANFHRAMLKKAYESIDKTPARYRDISSLTIPVSKETMKTVKKKIQDFRRELHAFIADQKGADTVYQFNFQLFNLSEVIWKDEGEK